MEHQTDRFSGCLSDRLISAASLADDFGHPPLPGLMVELMAMAFILMGVTEVGLGDRT